jgi:hypothetical protein
MGMSTRFAGRFGEFQMTEQKPASEKSWLISVIGIAVSLISVILAHFQRQQSRFWGVISVGALTALVGLYRPLSIRVRKLTLSAHNAKAVRRNRKELCRLSRQAGVFLDTSFSRNDILPGILQDISQRHPELVVASRIPNPGIFHEHWHYLDARIRANGLGANGFHDDAEELLSLLRSYTTFSVLPVFRMFAAEYREALSDSEKSKMNAFQQQYITFLGTYSGFLNRLNDEFHSMPEFHSEMAKPEPL